MQRLRLAEAKGSKEGSQILRFSVPVSETCSNAEGSKEGSQVFRFSVAGSVTSKGRRELRGFIGFQIQCCRV